MPCRDFARSLNTFTQFDACLIARNVHNPAGYCFAFMMLVYIFLNGRRKELFNPELQPTLLTVNLKNLSLDRLADFQPFLRVVQTLLGTHIADVNHALDSFGKLYEGAEFRKAGHRAF